MWSVLDVTIIRFANFAIYHKNKKAKEEKRILRGGLYDQYRYNGDPVLHDGNTECFTIDIMPLDKVTRIAQASA